MTRTAARIASGAHLYPGPDGVWRYHLPGDEFVRITAPAELLAAAQRLLHGAAGPAPIDALEQLLAAFDERGLLAPPPAGRPQALATVWVDGDNPVAEQVARLLQADVRVLTGPADEGAVIAADLVVSCAGWLPDARWRQLDTWCREHGTPWHMSYGEGRRWYAGPLAVPGSTAGYSDVRARRLAACGVPDELRAHWAYLDSTTVAPPVPWPSPGAAALLAGLIVNDILAWRDTGAAAAAGVQIGFDPATGELTRHPVLPLPALAEPDPQDRP
ncbi:hypothetical protein ABZS66_43120 [Dactylosporangium sp. NPDC005572]|uniref:hypothetical protein n=1 Tax=Dactylosporangium sp. NPDC005572 TaxID=3156889 RepID=UPI0033ACDF1B